MPLTSVEKLILNRLHKLDSGWSFGVTLAFELRSGSITDEGVAIPVPPQMTFEAIESLVRDGFLFRHELTDREAMECAGCLPRPGEDRCTYALTPKAVLQLEAR